MEYQGKKHQVLMSYPEAVEILMRMMDDCQLVEEVNALAMAVTKLTARHRQMRRHWAKRREIKLAEAMEAATPLQ